MNTEYKYITFKNGTCVIFPHHVNHDRMARVVDLPVLGAGFVRLAAREVIGAALRVELVEIIPYGESLSLNIGVHEHDRKILAGHNPMRDNF